MYYTSDDGKTYFADDASKVTPFDKDGKEAVRCYVFKCADGKPFVAYLERLEKTSKEKYNAARQQAKKGEMVIDLELIQMEGMEIKKPGDAKWTKRISAEGDRISQVNCPDGNNAALNIVLPSD